MELRGNELHLLAGEAPRIGNHRKLIARKSLCRKDIDRLKSRRRHPKPQLDIIEIM
jgi:hypothetical protein